MNKNSFCSCTCHKVTCMDLYEDAVFTTAHDDRKKRSWWEINLPFGMMRKIWRHAFFSLWQYLKMARSTVPSMAAVSRWLASFTALDCLFCSLAPPNITLVAQQHSPRGTSAGAWSSWRCCHCQCPRVNFFTEKTGSLCPCLIFSQNFYTSITSIFEYMHSILNIVEKIRITQMDCKSWDESNKAN